MTPPPIFIFYPQEAAPEEEEIEYDDEEDAIKQHLETDEALPTEILDKIFPQLWQNEPFK